MGLLETIFSKLTIKDIGFHLNNYAELYTKPLKVWKKVIINRKSSYDFVILHLIYYCLFVFFSIDDVKLAIPITILDAALTIIPLTIFILPFNFYNKKYTKKYTWNKLFRILLILKLQFVPIYLLLFILAFKLKIESLFLVTDNLIPFLLIAYVIIFPLIINLSISRKIVWILTNYIFLLASIIVIEFTIDFLDVSNNLPSILDGTPTGEYINFEIQNQLPPLLFDDTHYLIVAEIKNGQPNFIRTQFVSHKLLVSFLETKQNALKDSTLIKLHKANRLTLLSLDSFKNKLDLSFNSLLSETKRLKDSSKYKTNREYFTSYTNYLIEYEKSYTNIKEVNKVLRTQKLSAYIDLDSLHIAMIYNIDSDYYATTKNQLINIEKTLGLRAKKSSFVINILFYPVEFILDKFDY